MSDEPTKSIDGLSVEYGTHGEKRQIVGYLLEDGGVYWEFVRDGRKYPLRLSREGMDAMLAVWHQLAWGRVPVLMKHSAE